jgi:hypothetical protein
MEDRVLSPTTVWPVLKDATDAAVKIVDTSADWSTFRTKLSAFVTEGRQRGTLQSNRDVMRMIRSVQHGLELSADGSDALGLDKLVAIAAKTNEAIDGHK